MEWASSPSDGNYSLCCKARRHLSRVLDQILEQPASTSPPPVNPTLVGLGAGLENGIGSAEDALNDHAAAGTLAAMAGGAQADGASAHGLPTLPGLQSPEDDWENMNFFLDGLVDNSIDTMDWNLGL